MRMTKEYFDEHVVWAVELDYGIRIWEQVTGKKELDLFCELHRNDLSDIDFCTKQSDEHVRNFLNLVYYNCYNNPKFEKMGLYAVLDKALEAELEVA